MVEAAIAVLDAEIRSESPGMLVDGIGDFQGTTDNPGATLLFCWYSGYLNQLISIHHHHHRARFASGIRDEDI